MEPAVELIREIEDIDRNLMEGLTYFEEILRLLPEHLITEDKNEEIKRKLEITCDVIASNKEKLHKIIQAIPFN